MGTANPVPIVQKAARLLLAEDDFSLGDGVRAGLEMNGFELAWVTDGIAADRRLRECGFDLVVLDLGLPNLSGSEVLKGMRARGDFTPVLVLTAQGGVSDRIRGLNDGADDYLGKPFDLEELCARVRALCRRNCRPQPTSLRHATIELDLSAHVVTRQGRRVNLSPREYMLLKLLLENAGCVLSRSLLEENLYGWDADVESNTVEVHVHFLRKKLGDDLIRTVRGVGYVIDRLN